MRCPTDQRPPVAMVVDRRLGRGDLSMADREKEAIRRWLRECVDVLGVCLATSSWLGPGCDVGARGFAR